MGFRHLAEGLQAVCCYDLLARLYDAAFSHGCMMPRSIQPRSFSATGTYM